MIGLLAQAISSAEGWILYMTREAEKAGVSFNRTSTDMDPIRPAGQQFGYDLNPPPLIKVKVPPQAAGFVFGSTINRHGNDYIGYLRKHGVIELKSDLARSESWPDRRIGGRSMTGQNIDRLRVNVPADMWP